MEQGDFIDNFPMPMVPVKPFSINENQSNQLLLENYNVIILSQSCDLNKYGDEDDVILCPRQNFIETNQNNKDDWKKLVSGRIISLHLINKSDIENYSFDYQIVALNHIFPIPFGYVKEIAKQSSQRIRMLPPYREYLAQAFARQFLRIGLPIDLPKEYPYK
ncbi:MAG: hypothetical protein LLG42_15070 [Chloroflexi bacterium]|nr:hypothetical protein [Chloroflexota bacterium]